MPWEFDLQPNFISGRRIECGTHTSFRWTHRPNISGSHHPGTFSTSVLTAHLTRAFCFAGLGKTTPDPSASVTLDGVEVPLGTGISSGINDTCLLYNEYPFTNALCELGGRSGAVESLLCSQWPGADWWESLSSTGTHRVFPFTGWESGRPTCRIPLGGGPRTPSRNHWLLNTLPFQVHCLRYCSGKSEVSAEAEIQLQDVPVVNWGMAEAWSSDWYESAWCAFHWLTRQRDLSWVAEG